MIQKKRRVCIVSEFPPPDGGIGQQANLLFESLRSENIDVCRIDTNGYLKTVLKVYQNLRIIKSLIAFSHFVVNLFRNVPDRDIVHILSGSYLNFFLFTFPTVIVGKIFRKKIIIHYHGGCADDFLSKWRLFAGAVLLLADHLIFPSGFLVDVFEKFGFKGELIPNLLNLKNFSFTERKVFRPKYIVTRHLRSEYNVACVIKAFSIIRKQHPEAMLRIVGDGYEKPYLMELTRQLGCEQEVIFMGRVPNASMPNLYDCSDFVFNASMVDNMPVSIMEAFARGCPVITTNAGGIPYLVKHRINGLLVGLNDHEAMAKEALWALKNQAKTARIAKNAKNEVHKFSWNQIRKSIFQIYDSKPYN